MPVEADSPEAAPKSTFVERPQPSRKVAFSRYLPSLFWHTKVVLWPNVPRPFLWIRRLLKLLSRRDAANDEMTVRDNIFHRTALEAFTRALKEIAVEDH